MEVFDNYIVSSVDAGSFFNQNKYFLVGASAHVCRFWAPDYSSASFGLGPSVQIYLLNRAHTRFYLEGKGAVLYMFPEYPATAINYSFFGGPTCDIQMQEKGRLKLGLGYNHVSNAKRKEQPTNGSWDGLGFSIGWVFK